MVPVNERVETKFKALARHRHVQRRSRPSVPPTAPGGTKICEL